MNAKPTDIIRRIYELFAEGQLDATFHFMDPDVQIIEPGDPTKLPWAGEFRGHDGLRRFYAGLASALSQITIETSSLQFREMGDGLVFVRGTERGVSASTGRTYQTDSAWVWTVSRGRATAMQAFHDTDAMTTAIQP